MARHARRNNSRLAVIACSTILIAGLASTGTAMAASGTLTSSRTFTPVTQAGVATTSDDTTTRTTVDDDGDDESGTVTSGRSFDTTTDTGDTEDADATESVTVDADEDWGGIETLSIPDGTIEEEEDEEETADQATTAGEDKTATETPVQSDATTQTVTVPESGTASDSQVVQFALQYVGYPYVWGGSSPSTGFDCSGFTRYVYAQFGISLPHQSESQRAWALANGTQVSAADAQPGDLMWKYGHVGIYIGDGMMVHASTSSTGVIVSSVYATFEYYRII